MEWFVENHGVAGFANTRDSRRQCNARFVPLGQEVFLLATDDISEGEEVFAYYDSTAELAAKERRKRAREARLAAKALAAKQRYAARKAKKPSRS